MINLIVSSNRFGLSHKKKANRIWADPKVILILIWWNLSVDVYCEWFIA